MQQNALEINSQRCWKETKALPPYTLLKKFIRKQKNYTGKTLSSACQRQFLFTKEIKKYIVLFSLLAGSRLQVYFLL